MDRDLKKIVVICIVVLAVGGWSALANLWVGVGEVLVEFFPFIAQAAKQSIEDYLTSPYFITGVILLGLSGLGIWVGHKGGKAIYTVVSLITACASLVSIGANIL